MTPPPTANTVGLNQLPPCLPNKKPRGGTLKNLRPYKHGYLKNKQGPNWKVDFRDDEAGLENQTDLVKRSCHN